MAKAEPDRWDMSKRRVYTDVDRPVDPGLLCLEPSKTRQSEAAACDINLIVKQFSVTGFLPDNGRTPFYADVSEMGDFRAALDYVREAEAVFMALPAKVRTFFDNDAATFVDFCSDEANRPQMVELGLLAPEPAPAPEALSIKAPVVP